MRLPYEQIPKYPAVERKLQILILFHREGSKTLSESSQKRKIKLDTTLIVPIELPISIRIIREKLSYNAQRINRVSRLRTVLKKVYQTDRTGSGIGRDKTPGEKKRNRRSKMKRVSET